MKKIAILGATGYIGRSLVREFFFEKKDHHLFLFSRSTEKLYTHILEVPKNIEYSVHSYETFNKGEYDVIINCVGVSSSLILQKNPYEVFTVTEEVDSLVIEYLHHHPKALYINMSSGAVYGSNFESAVTEKSTSILSSGFCERGEFYAIAKINAEAKHRALSNYNIVDMRVFGFFGSLVDVDSPFLLSEIVKSIADKKVFITEQDDIIRDYITAKDLLAFIKLIIKKNKINDYFDICSKKSISKFTLLQALTKKYGLVYEVHEKKGKLKNSTQKNFYSSKSKKAKKVLGFEPSLSSLDGIISELSRVSLE
jgi:nucleoside-diphosphate-sugar epimerase